MIKLASAAVFLAVVVVAVLIVVSQNQSDGGGDASSVEGAAEVERQLSGIPQQGMVLGEPSAKVTLIEFGDLQCPVCKGFAEEVIPPMIESQVRSGEAKLDFRNFTIISQESIPAGAAAIAAGEQGRGWNFVELFYRNQGVEASGYVTDEFLTAIAEGRGRAGHRQVGQATARASACSARSKTRPKKRRSSASAARRRSRSKARAPRAWKTLGTPGSAEPLEASDRSSRLADRRLS